MLRLALLASIGVYTHARSNLCFTARAADELTCREILSAGELALHRESGASIVHVRPAKCGIFGKCSPPKLCETPSCQRCLAPGDAWVGCSKVGPWPVIVMTTNSDLPSNRAIAFAVCLISIPAIMLYMLMTRKSTPATPTDGEPKKGFALKIALAMLQFASRPWFPWLAAFGTAVNLFTLVFTAATVVLFLAAVLGRPRAWRSTALANAIGATVGSGALLILLRSQGVDMINEQFPTVFNSPAWAKMMGIMQGNGVAGMVGVSALPLILHPIIAFGVLSGMSDLSILAVVLLGRTIKYLVMAYITTTAPTFLKYFGISANLFELASSATAKKPTPPKMD